MAYSKYTYENKIIASIFRHPKIQALYYCHHSIPGWRLNCKLSRTGNSPWDEHLIWCSTWTVRCQRYNNRVVWIIFQHYCPSRVRIENSRSSGKPIPSCQWNQWCWHTLKKYREIDYILDSFSLFNFQRFFSTI